MKISIFFVAAAITAAFVVVAASPAVYALVSGDASSSDIGISRVKGLNAFDGVNLFGYGWGYQGMPNPFVYPSGQYGYFSRPSATGSSKQACVWNGYNWRCNDFGK
jgi:hypothetical protein